ncbi:unnamed protein product [Rotaria magnacalcarata]|uniref:Retrotransposon gag domain-containing protein n=1 Tax=Rotaria magnacalcarata TaxID=392030 RepID=A0A816WGS0_9BILA|nr:unnamed protein product [Rotaria magnacalcarata]CAF4345495.1 unnamed protein product [Rotaria magnacalcarata]
MSTENVSAQEAVNRLVGAQETTAKRINKLEGQVDELLEKFIGHHEQNANADATEIETENNGKINVEASNASKIIKLEGQIDEMSKAIQEYREQNMSSTRTEFQTVFDRMESMQALNASYFDEAASKYEESKRQWRHMCTDMNNNMNCILNKLEAITGTRNMAANTDGNIGHPLQTTTYPTTGASGHSFQTNPYLVEAEEKQQATTQSIFPLNGLKHSIIIPPSSAAPAFHGKQSESPTQFLIRVQEYAESVHAWDHPTLLKGISQFLRDSALEWYCQLRMSRRRPKTWVEFTDLFMAQFNSPVRKAKQEQEWHECQQRENETVNEFLIRLRALWTAVKPKETEAELIRHLFCKMRNELIVRIGLTRWDSLDDMIIEAQKVEEILCRRNKEQRRAVYMKQIAPQDDTSYHNTRLNDDNINQVLFSQTAKRGESTKSRTLPCLGIMNDADKHSERCEAIDEKIRLHSQIFVCSRSTDCEERRSRLDQSVIQTQNEDRREIKNIMPPIKIDQETSCDQQSKITTGLDEECDANGFWPEGTESWHIHAIKPQREIFTRRTIPDPIITAQQTSIESQSEISEKSSDFQIGSLRGESVPVVNELNYLQSQKIMHSMINDVKLVEQISQNVENSVQLSPAIPAVNKQQQSYLETSEKAIIGHRLELQPNQHNLNRKPRLYGLLHASNLPILLSSHNHSHNSLLLYLNICLVQGMLFLCSILIRVGIAYNMPSLPDTYHAQSPTTNAEFTINSMPRKCSRNYVTKSSSFTKTIEILRDLESLLIYGIA